MPASALHTRLADAVTELGGLLAELERVLPHKPREGFRAGGSGKGTRSTALTSWNSPVAMVILSVHAGVRELEHDLQYRVSGVLRERGASDGNTLAAMDSVLNLAAAVDEWAQRDAVRKLEGWGWRARIALGIAEPFLHVPRVPGRPASRCPGCRYATLRYKPLSGIVRCVNPACCDADGRRMIGHIEFGSLSGEPLLVWQDQSIGLPQDQEREMA